MNTVPGPSQEIYTFSPPTGMQVYKDWRERFIRPVLVGTSIFGLLALVAAFAANRNLFFNIVVSFAYLSVLLVTLFKTPYWVRVGAFLLAAYALGLNEFLQTGILGRASFFFLGLVLFATLMVSPRAGAAALAVALLTFAAGGFLVSGGIVQLLNPMAIRARLIDYVSISATNLLFGAVFIFGLDQLLRAFLHSQGRTSQTVRALQSERATLESRVAARTSQLSAVNEVGRVANSILNPEELTSRVANLITDQFGYYYAALFLLDESGEQAWLYSATGEAGRVLKENKHHLRVGGNSMVGMAISKREPRVALDVGAEPVRFENPLLPYTRSEVALPLTIGDRVLGALDVQSTKAGAFGPQELETLQGMANQVAIALENARLFAESQKSLDEMQAVQRQFVLDAWKPIAANQELDYRLGEDEPADNSIQLEVPLALREQVIGQIDLSGEGEWTPEQRSLIETVASQAALALENARLVEQTQAAAQREHQAAEITSRIWTATSMDDILQTAIGELGRALDVQEATIELNMDGHNE